MKHWIRDLQLSFVGTRGLGQVDYVLFHFLRTAGWTWLWECDGYAGDTPNRVADGNMELVGVANWTAIGGVTRTKVTTPVHSGTQALSVASSAVGDGVESTIFTGMENLKAYHVSIWAHNDTGQPWDVLIDTGTGYVVVGTIPDNGGVYTLSHFSFTSAAAGNRKLKIVDNLGSLGTIYLSDILIFKSYFEYNPTDLYPSGTDGSTINPNQFSSLSYLFVVGDVGKVVCIWDPVNNKNSGAYKITAAAGGVATLELRSGSAALVAQSGLSWRMIDLTKAPENSAGTDTGQRGAGFGLQSPHSSKWRLFVRQCLYGSAGGQYEVVGVWGAPLDTDFDFSTGAFYKTGPSTQNTKEAAYTLWPNTGNWTNMHYWNCGDDATVLQRFFLMTDDDGSFLSMVMWDTGANLWHDCPVIGYMGSSPYLPDEEAWALFARWQTWSTTTWTATYWDADGRRFSYSGTMIGPDGLAKDATWAQYGYGDSTSDVVTQSNAGPNPWSAQEWLHSPIIVRDPDGVTGFPAEMTADIGVYQGRANLPNLSTFDSANYIHFDYGLIWEWSGETILP